MVLIPHILSCLVVGEHGYVIALFGMCGPIPDER